jgi:hypothetical protein
VQSDSWRMWHHMPCSDTVTVLAPPGRNFEESDQNQIAAHCTYGTVKEFYSVSYTTDDVDPGCKLSVTLQK